MTVIFSLNSLRILHSLALHLRSLQLDASEATGKAGNGRVRQVAGDQSPHVIQFLLGGLVSLGFFTCQQFRPTHADLLLQTASVLVKRR